MKRKTELGKQRLVRKPLSAKAQLQHKHKSHAVANAMGYKERKAHQVRTEIRQASAGSEAQKHGPHPEANGKCLWA